MSPSGFYRELMLLFSRGVPSSLFNLWGLSSPVQINTYRLLMLCIVSLFNVLHSTDKSILSRICLSQVQNPLFGNIWFPFNKCRSDLYEEDEWVPNIVTLFLQAKLFEYMLYELTTQCSIDSIYCPTLTLFTRTHMTSVSVKNFTYILYVRNFVDMN